MSKEAVIRSGSWALVTGASSGIGLAFVQELARRGLHVILVARSEDTLRKVAAEIVARHGVTADVIRADLGEPGAVAHVAAEVRRLGRSVDLLINNAGLLTHGRFETNSPQREQQEIMVNNAALVGLTHALLPDMLARGHGGIINVASTAAFQPIPYMAIYAATKAFVLSFSVALREELRGRGVNVLALCPGVTKTELFTTAEAGAAEKSLGRPRTAEQVVATGLRALEAGRGIKVDGFLNAITSMSTHLSPRWLSAWIAGRMVAPEDR